MASVRFEHVTKKFGPTVALENLDLEIEDGEFLVLVGPSGCGKSTALRLLAGLEEITSGHIFIADRRVDNLAAKDRDLAMVFQSYALYPHMTVRDNIAFGLKLRKEQKSEIQRRVEEAANLLRIEDLLMRKPGQLSGGQRQRVALGRAIVREPAAFLLDEPLSNLDAQLRVQTRAELAKLYERLGSTFIYVTHDQVEAVTMATRIAVLNRGRLQQVGTPKELYERPQNMFVASFIGSPSMNFFDATVEKTEGGLALASPLGQIPLPSTLANRLEAHAGETVVGGIRPEDVHDAAYQPIGTRTSPIEATADLVEHLGSEAYVYLETNGVQIVGRFDPRTEVETGQPVRAAVNLERIHVFGKTDELAL